MNSKTRIRLQLFLYSLILAFLLSLVTVIVSKGINNFSIFEKSFITVFIIFLLISFLSLIFFTNFFIYKRVQEISDQIFFNDSNISRTELLNKLVQCLYSRSISDEFKQGKFRITGDTIDVFPAHTDYA